MTPERPVPAAWMKFEMSGVADSDEAFHAFATSVGINPDTEWFSPAEHKVFILSAMKILNDEHLGHCKMRVPTGTFELAFRVMDTAEDIQEAIELLQDFSNKVCQTRKITQLTFDDHIILQFEIDGLTKDRSAVAELTVMFVCLFGMSAFAGSLIAVEEIFSRSLFYTQCFQKNTDIGSPISHADFTGLKISKSALSLPRKPGRAFDTISTAIRWALLANKFRPIIARSQLPLLTAEGMLETSKSITRQRNVDTRQQRRIAQQTTNYSIRELENCIKASNAMVLLSTTQKSIEEIGIELEFSDDRSFNRFFKKVIGYTPARYRRIYQDASVAEGHDHFTAALAAVEAIHRR